MKFLFIFVLFFFTLKGDAFLRYDDNTQILQESKRYITKNSVLTTPKYSFVVHPLSLRLKEDFALLNGVVTYEDGSIVPTDYIEDLIFVLCLQRQKGKWHVVYDLSRNDVPSITQMQEIQKEFPKDFPIELLPKFWQDKLTATHIRIQNKKDITLTKNDQILLKNKLLPDGKYEIWFDGFVYMRFNIKNKRLEGLFEQYSDPYSVIQKKIYRNTKY